MARILVVDDDPQIRRSLLLALRNRGHDVDVDSDGDAAIERLDQASYDYVLTDIVMPGKTGLDVVYRVRSDQPEARVVAMSGYDMGRSLDFLTAARELGAHQTLKKPFTLAELDEILEN